MVDQCIIRDKSLLVVAIFDELPQIEGWVACDQADTELPKGPHVGRNSVCGLVILVFSFEEANLRRHVFLGADIHGRVLLMPIGGPLADAKVTDLDPPVFFWWFVDNEEVLCFGVRGEEFRKKRK